MLTLLINILLGIRHSGAFISHQNPEGYHVQFIESSKSKDISVDILMKEPKGGPFDRAMSNIITRAILDGVDGYGKQDLIEYTAPSGSRIESEYLNSSIHISFGLKTSDKSTLAPLLDAILFHANLTESSVLSAKDTLASEQKSYWDSALNSELLPYSDVRQEDIDQAYRRLRNPSSMYVLIQLPGHDQTLEGSVDGVLSQEVEPDSRPYLSDPTKPVQKTSRLEPLDTFTLRSTSVGFNSLSFPANLLAMACLGDGKGSILFQGVRQKLDFTYRQEADFTDGSEGICPVIVLVSASSDQAAERLKLIQTSLSDGVSKLTDADLKRARLMLQANFQRDIGMNPFYTLSPHDFSMLFMKNYWFMKTGANWDFKKIESMISTVTLDQVKEAATKIVNEGSWNLIKGQ